MWQVLGTSSHSLLPESEEESKSKALEVKENQTMKGFVSRSEEVGLLLEADRSP